MYSVLFVLIYINVLSSVLDRLFREDSEIWEQAWERILKLCYNGWTFTSSWERVIEAYVQKKKKRKKIRDLL